MNTPLRMGGTVSGIFASAVLIGAIFLLGCSSSNSGSTPPPTFTIGGTVSGLAGSGLVLQDNGGNNLPVSANGSFTFTTPIAMGSAYSVTVFTQPSNLTQSCVPTVASGTVGSANVTTVVVTCTTSKFTVGGMVATLAGSGLVLQDNLGNNLPVSANGSFTFTTAIASGSTYSVTVFSQPSNVTQTCVPTAASGTVTTGNVTTVVVTCTTDSFTVGGTVAGLLGSGLVLQDNGGNNLPISANGTFTFTTSLLSGATFSVTASTEPATPAQVCTGGSGTVTSGPITTVSVNCVTSTTSTTALAVADSSNNRVLILDAPFSTDQAASVVLGEPDFLTSTGGTTASTMSGPSELAEDHPGTHLYVAENGNCRVLQFVAPFTNGMNASVVFGQTDFVSANNCSAVGTITASSLGVGNTVGGSGGDGDNVFGVLVDTAGNLWIADNAANRVLEYTPPFSNGMAATLVIGQANFTSGNTNQGAAGLSDPVPFFDLFGNLWVADYSNNRVLEFKKPFSTGMSASLVLGQANFTDFAPNENGAIAANSLSLPNGGAFDALGNLWIADFSNSRVLEFVPPFTTNMAATLVLGQTNFVNGAPGNTSATLNSPAHVSFDSSGNLFVADEANNRTLMFTPPFTTGMSASLVLGQSGFTSNGSATSTTGESFPSSAIPLPPPF